MLHLNILLSLSLLMLYCCCIAVDATAVVAAAATDASVAADDDAVDTNAKRSSSRIISLQMHEILLWIVLPCFSYYGNVIFILCFVCTQ